MRGELVGLRAQVEELARAMAGQVRLTSLADECPEWEWYEES